LRNAKEVRDAGRFHVAVGDDGPAQAADPAVLELLQRTWQALSADQAATQAFMFDPHATVEAARGNATQQTVDAANRALDIAFGFPPAIPELEIFLVTRNLNVP
jgi:hypothetical protein